MDGMQGIDRVIREVELFDLIRDSVFQKGFI